VPVHPVERKLAAIFAAGIAGCSRLMARNEVGTLARLKTCRAIIDELIASDRGRIFDTADDSVVADFASAVDPVRCAVAEQAAMAAENAAGIADEPMQLRIGVHEACQLGSWIMRGIRTERFRMGVIAPLLPNKPRGVQRVDDRRVVERDILGAATGAPWRALPKEFGPLCAVAQSRRLGPHLAAATTAYNGKPQMIDSTSVPVQTHTANSKKPPGSLYGPLPRRADDKGFTRLSTPMVCRLDWS
jgi:transposase